MVERAGVVKVEASDLRWFDRERYSNRQERGMQLGCLTGAGIGKTMPAVKNHRIIEVTQSSRCISLPDVHPFLQEAFHLKGTS